MENDLFAKYSKRLQNASNIMQSLTIQRIYQFSREQYLYLISFALFAYWCYEAVEWYFHSLKRFGTGSILKDQITQLYLLYAVTPAVYAWCRSAHVQEHRVLRFALKSFLGLMLTMSVLLGMVFSYLITGTNG